MERMTIEETARYNEVLAQSYKTLWEDEAKKNETLRIQYDAEFEAFKMSYRNRSIRRLNVLEEWLTEYRDQLKKENVYHKNTGIINAINELLNETSTDI